MPDPIPLDYRPHPPRSSPKGVIAILIALTVFAARVATIKAPPPKPLPIPAPVMPNPAGLDMTMGNSLNHNSEGQNVLYADGHITPTTQPYSDQFRGTNSNAWLANIYSAQTTNLTTQPGVVFGVPYDDKDTTILPTSN